MRPSRFSTKSLSGSTTNGPYTCTAQHARSPCAGTTPLRRLPGRPSRRGRTLRTPTSLVPKTALGCDLHKHPTRPKHVPRNAPYERFGRQAPHPPSNRTSNAVWQVLGLRAETHYCTKASGTTEDRRLARLGPEGARRLGTIWLMQGSPTTSCVKRALAKFCFPRDGRSCASDSWSRRPRTHSQPVRRRMLLSSSWSERKQGL